MLSLAKKPPNTRSAGLKSPPMSMNENSGFLILYFKHHVPIAFKKTEVLNHRADELKAFLEAKTDRSFRSFRR